MKKYDILIVNQPLNNRGDESAHKALVRSLVKSIPNVRIKVFFIGQRQDTINQYDVNRPEVSYENVRPLKGWWSTIKWGMKSNKMFLAQIHPTVRKIIGLYKRANVVLCAPGGICMGGFQNWGHVLMLSIAKFLNKPIAYYGRSIGPFPTLTQQNRLFKETSLDLLHYFSFLSLRDRKSIDLAESLGVKYEPTVDSAFLEMPRVDVPQDVKELIGTLPYVVFVPNLLIWHYAYRNKAGLDDVLKFYRKILDLVVAKYPEHNIVMLPQTFDYGTYDGDDINFFQDLKRYVQRENVIIVPDTYSSDVQQTIISGASCMIGARYHSVVFAINQAIPFVALSYEHKISGLLETLHKTESMVDITTIFDSDDSMNCALEKFSLALNCACEDVCAQKLSKEIAQGCFDKFLVFESTCSCCG